MVKKSSLSKILFAVLLLVLFLALISYKKTGNIIQTENCELSPNRYMCYQNRVQEITKSSGTKAALKYIDTIVLTNSQYGLAHLILHIAGENAYLESRDLNKALSFAPGHTEINHDIHMNGYDGFVHGVFRGYFLINREEKSYPELIQDVCGQYFNASSTNNNSPSKAHECAHGVGHALMYSLNNEVDDSIKICQELPSEDMIKGCYKGVFMENGYLYMTFYEEEKPKPDVKDDFMVSLCNGSEDIIGDECSVFIADAYLSVNRRDTKGALANCQLLIRKERQKNCVHRIGAIYITGYHANDFGKMITACEESGDEFIEVCLHAVEDGIKLGAAGEHNKNIKFCDLVGTEYREVCLKGE